MKHPRPFQQFCVESVVVAVVTGRQSEMCVRTGQDTDGKNYILVPDKSAEKIFLSPNDSVILNITSNNQFLW